MLLAVDIGNTNISFGVFSGVRLIRRFNIPTKAYSPGTLRRSLGTAKIEEAIICSVVPQSTKTLVPELRKMLGKKPYIIGKDIKVPVKNLYRDPRQVGQDRLVNAFAAAAVYGAPVIVVDFGTAVTFDVISAKAQYSGGMILPGLQISLDALAEHTALLPKIRLSRPKEFFGRDTKSSMLSGVVYGFAALTDNLCARIKKKLGRNTRVIATGGNAGVIAKFCRQLDKIDINLTLKGLNMIYNKLRIKEL